jgi:23S rRNA (guanosine2251-2'-O)-methyltransferase
LRSYGSQGRRDPPARPAKRGPGAKPSAERARHNRARNLEESRRKKTFLARQSQGIETTQEVVAKRSMAGEPDRPEYLARQVEHAQFVTIFGRKTVREALRDPSMAFRHIHMEEKLIAMNSNVKRMEADPVILEILDLIRERGITLIPSDKMRISFISKAGKQDGGIVADLLTPHGSKLSNVSDFLSVKHSHSYKVLALDQITTPANMGMIIRSAVASGSFNALLVGPGSVSVTNPLVIKASATTALMPAKNALTSESNGTVFITAKESMFQALTQLKEDGAEIVLLSARPNLVGENCLKTTLPRDIPTVSLWDYKPPKKCVFVIGGESAGHDPAIDQVATVHAHIPMIEGVESLNCAVTGSLVAFAPHLRPTLL